MVAAEAGNLEGRVYVVQKGDNLSLIAEKFKVPLAALLIWNRIESSRVIHPGQELVISPPSTGMAPGPDDAGDRSR